MEIFRKETSRQSKSPVVEYALDMTYVFKNIAMVAKERIHTHGARVEITEIS